MANSFNIAPDGSEDYTSLNTAIDANVQDLTASGHDIFFNCVGTGYDTMIAGFQTGWNCGSQEIVVSGFLVEPVWQEPEDIYIINVSAGAGINLPNSEACNVRINGIQINCGPTSSDYGVWTHASNVLVLENCIIGYHAETTSHGVVMGSNTAVLYAYNCITWNIGTDDTTGIGWNLSNSTATLYNCGNYGGYIGFNNSSSGVMEAKNCWAASGSLIDFDTGWDVSSNNISLDDTAPGADSVTGYTMPFADPVNGDFTLTSSVGSGFDLSASGITTDMTGVTRDWGTWDVGPHQYIQNTWIVNTDAAGDYDYTSLNSAVDATARDLTNIGLDMYYLCSGVADDTTAASFQTGWNCGSQKIIVSGEVNSAIWDEDKYLISATSTALSPPAETCVVEFFGLQLKPTSSAGGYVQTDDVDATIENCIIGGDPSLSNNHGFRINDGTANLYNCLVFNLAGTTPANSTRAFFTDGSNAAITNYYNCGASGYIYGFRMTSSATAEVKNSWAVNNTTADFDTVASIHWKVSNNISSDATATGDNSISGVSILFTDPGNFDFSIDSADTSTIRMGFDLSTSGITHDIKQKQRIGAWTIGPDQYIQTTYIVDTDSNSVRDYASLNAAVDDIGGSDFGDLVANEQQITIECKATASGADTVSASIPAGWSTSETYHLIIKASDNDVAGPQWDTGKYRLSGPGKMANHTGSDAGHVTYSGLQIEMTGATYHGLITINTATSGKFYILGCFLRSTVGNVGNVGVYAGHYTNKFYIANNIVHGFNGASESYGFRLHQGNSYVSNNLAYDCRIGYWKETDTNNSVYLQNNIAQNCSLSGYHHNNTGWETEDYNCDDVFAPGTNTQVGVVTFVDSGAGNFALADGDTVAKDNGADLSADVFSFNTSMGGDIRTVPWCMGPFENDASTGPGEIVTGLRFAHLGKRQYNYFTH